MWTRIVPASIGLLAAVALPACNISKSSNPLSPSIAGPIPGVVITQPIPLEPPANAKFPADRQPLTLVIENATTNGVRPLSYVFEVAIDADFNNKVFVREGITPGDGRTSVQLPDRLASDRTYYWRARALDGANSGDFSQGVHFNVFTPIVIGEPVLRSPGPNSVLTTMRPTFDIGNAPRSGPVGAIRYQLELSDTITFAKKIAVWTFNEETDGDTDFLAPHDLNPDAIYYWRVRAADPTTTGPFSGIWAFVTPSIPSPGGGGIDPGAPCGQSSPQAILNCHRNKYGTPMSKSQQLAFLQGSARDLNAAGVSGGPFGILEKTSGNNCGGYSCDIICAGQGNAQKQWDVLIDENFPIWGSPNTISDNIRVDTCVIQ
jgi:hypothetical protein